MYEQLFYQHKAIGFVVLTTLTVYATTTSATHLDTAQQELDAQRQQWQSLNIEDYIYRFERICYCVPEYVDPGLVHVIGGEIDSVAHAVTGNTLNPSLFLAVNDLFDEVQAAIYSHADEMFVEYDGILGNPTIINIDFSKYMADEEMSFRASNLREMPGGVSDFNYDGVVDVADLGILGANFGQSGMAFGQGDFNGDGIVDVWDLGILGANWTASQSTGNASALVPEPTTLSLLAMSVLMVGRRRRSGGCGRREAWILGEGVIYSRPRDSAV